MLLTQVTLGNSPSLWNDLFQCILLHDRVLTLQMGFLHMLSYYMGFLYFDLEILLLFQLDCGPGLADNLAQSLLFHNGVLRFNVGFLGSANWFSLFFHCKLLLSLCPSFTHDTIELLLRNSWL
jgi:hypothetical protein